MRLLFLSQTYPRFPADTAGPFIRDLARALVGHGWGVTVLAPHAPGLASRWQDGGVEVVTFRYAPAPLEVLGYSRSLDADERVRGRALAVAPLYLAGARRALGRELVRRRYHLVHAHWVVPNGLPAAAFAARMPVALGIHGSDVFLAEKAPVRPLVRRILRRAGLLTGCSPELVERVCLLGFPREKARVIPYGVDPRLFSPDPARGRHWREKLGIPAHGVVLLAVGRMVTKKGFHYLVEILPDLLQRTPFLHVILAGGGDRLEEYRRRMASWRERVHLPGPVLRDSLPDLYRAADLFVLPAVHDSQGNVDGLPNVILEAMASGLPVVASGISGIPLAVENGRTGRLVPEGDLRALATALEALLENSSLRREMGRAGRRRVESDLTWEAIARRYIAAYQEILSLPPAGC